MVKKALIEVMSSAKRIKESVITSWERYLPSRHSLLMSLCDSSEKVWESIPSFNLTAQS